jgi:hypothetical protein
MMRSHIATGVLSFFAGVLVLERAQPSADILPAGIVLIFERFHHVVTAAVRAAHTSQFEVVDGGEGTYECGFE